MNGDTLDGVNGSFWEEAQSRDYLMAIEPEIMYNNYEGRALDFWKWAEWWGKFLHPGSRNQFYGQGGE